jgi:hypothetical protein
MAEHPSISFLLDQPVHEQTALYYLFLDILYSGVSKPSTYAIDAAKQIGVDQNVLEMTLAKLRSSNLANNAPAINNTMPQLIPDENPELIFPAISSRGSLRSLIRFLTHVKQTYPDVFRSIRRFQHFLNDSCYCSADKTKYNPHYHRNGNQSMATFYFQQYKIESYRIKQQSTGSGGDPDDEFDPDDEDDFSADDYKDLDGLKESDKKKLPEAVLGYRFAEEEMRKIISWLDKFAALLKAQAYETSTEVRNLFKENGELAKRVELTKLDWLDGMDKRLTDF